MKQFSQKDLQMINLGGLFFVCIALVGLPLYVWQGEGSSLINLNQAGAFPLLLP